MRSRAVFIATLLALAAANWAYADEILLWDNYCVDPPVFQDPSFKLSSERETQIMEATWSADDVDMLQSPLAGVDPAVITLTRLEWVGARDPAWDPYPLADVIILDADPNGGPGVVQYLEQDLTYAYTDFDPDPDPDPEAQTYTGVITFDPPIPLTDLGQEIEHFYIGVRLVNGTYRGRNYFVNSYYDLEAPLGRTEGYTKGATFGAPDWTPSSDVYYGMPAPEYNFEFAFRLWAIPEPSGIALLALGSGLLLARRR
jgi:hypothetical protein